jgi:hypothetical protein
MVKLILVLLMSGALAESLAPAPPPLLIDSAPRAATAPLDASN